MDDFWGLSRCSQRLISKCSPPAVCAVRCGRVSSNHKTGAPVVLGGHLQKQVKRTFGTAVVSCVLDCWNFSLHHQKRHSGETCCTHASASSCLSPMKLLRLFIRAVLSASVVITSYSNISSLPWLLFYFFIKGIGLQPSNLLGSVSFVGETSTPSTSLLV